jgi:hypothetical protein
MSDGLPVDGHVHLQVGIPLDTFLGYARRNLEGVVDPSAAVQGVLLFAEAGQA